MKKMKICIKLYADSNKKKVLNIKMLTLCKLNYISYSY